VIFMLNFSSKSEIRVLSFSGGVPSYIAGMLEPVDSIDIIFMIRMVDEIYDDCYFRMIDNLQKRHPKAKLDIRQNTLSVYDVLCRSSGVLNINGRAMCTDKLKLRHMKDFVREFKTQDKKRVSLVLRLSG